MPNALFVTMGLILIGFGFVLLLTMEPMLISFGDTGPGSHWENSSANTKFFVSNIVGPLAAMFPLMWFFVGIVLLIMGGK